MTGASHWDAVLAEVNQAGGCAHPIRLRGITLDRSTGELVESGDNPRPVQGPPGRRLPVVLAPLPGRRLAVGGGRHPWWQGGQLRSGRAPPALRHLDRTLLRAGAPRRPRRPRPPTLSAPEQGGGDLSASRGYRCPALVRHGEGESKAWASRCVRSASITPAPCCGTPTSRGCGSGPCSSSTAQVAKAGHRPSVQRPTGTVGGPPLLHEGGRVPAAGPGPPPCGGPGRRP